MSVGPHGRGPYTGHASFSFGTTTYHLAPGGGGAFCIRFEHLQGPAVLIWECVTKKIHT